jgi:hypothetical protein
MITPPLFSGSKLLGKPNPPGTLAPIVPPGGVGLRKPPGGCPPVTITFGERPLNGD